ncbi:hypothetical protein [Saccharothrix sp. Mg75]|uniref:hypothetical protein n=1 Tax=Saccharothrix sp. Mg75 TaxID=3445357 RepID=UPI003EF00D39
MRIVPAALVAAIAAALLALGAGSAAAEQPTPDHDPVAAVSKSLALPQAIAAEDNRDM